MDLAESDILSWAKKSKAQQTDTDRQTDRKKEVGSRKIGG